jgi:hypothetical protein
MKVTYIFKKKEAFLYHHFSIEPWYNYEVALIATIPHISSFNPNQSPST